MITFDGNCFEELRRGGARSDIRGQCRDAGAVIVVGMGSRSESVPGTLHVVADPSQVCVEDMGKPEDRFRIFTSPAEACPSECSTNASAGVKIRGFIWQNGIWSDVDVAIIPVRGELFSRFEGLLETSLLQAATVFIMGLGSVGSYVADQLVKSGIFRFLMMDHDRLQVGNIMRHVLGVSDVGRRKVYAMADWVREKNPHALVKAWAMKASDASMNAVRDCVRAADVVVCAVDNHVGRQLVNLVCVEERKPLLVAGAYRRAYGCQVLRIRPQETLCYQCYMMMLSGRDRDEEVSNPEQAAGIAYTDRPVPVEPGLSIDIAPLGYMVAKLAVQELLQCKETTLRYLDEDLTASWYFLLNRREPGTPYASWGPLGCNVDGMRILRWYGVDAKPNPHCPICGDFLPELHRRHGVEPTSGPTIGDADEDVGAA